MTKQEPSAEQTVSALRLSIYDGAFANIFANLTGSVFLPAYALVLGANSLQIGILAAIPFFANLAQLGGSYLVEKYNRRKHVAVRFSLLARTLWILIIILSFNISNAYPTTLLKMVIAIIIGYNIMASISSVSWLSWMSLQVPDVIRGRYFGLRNAILGAMNIAFTLAGGLFLDRYKQINPHNSNLHAFEILFSFAVACGFLSLFFLNKQPEPSIRPVSKISFSELYRSPWQQSNFKNLIRFAVFWSFVVNMASPFFLVYMLKDLELKYTIIAIITVSSAFTDLIGMWIWGHVSDRLGNKPVIIISAIVASILPILWLFTDKNHYVIIMVLLLHLLGGFFWAGYNLCSINLLFRMVPKERNSTYFAFWSSLNGIAAGCGALLGGILVKYFHEFMPTFNLSHGTDYKLIFLISGLLRLVALFILSRVQEPMSLPFAKAIRVLRSVKSWATMMGFHPSLHFYLPEQKSNNDINAYWPIWRFRRN